MEDLMSTHHAPGPRTVPKAVRRGIVAAAYAITTITAAANYGHVRTLALFAGQGDGQATLAALIPDVLLAVSITVLAFRSRQWWAWIGLASAVAFVTWAAVVTSLSGFCLVDDPECGGLPADDATRVIVAVWPLWVAVQVAGLAATFVHRPVKHTVSVVEHGRTPGTGEGVLGGVSADRAPGVLGGVLDPVSGGVPVGSGEGVSVPVTALPITGDDGSGVGASRRPASASAAVATSKSTVSASAETTTVRPGMSDPEIIAALRDAPSAPSLRDTMRTYSLGQNRARRLLDEAFSQVSTRNDEDQTVETTFDSARSDHRNTHQGTTSEVGRPRSARDGDEAAGGKAIRP